jgi:hypothetical protein
MNDPKANNFDVIWGTAGAIPAAAENTADEKPAVEWPADEAWWDAVLEGVPKRQVREREPGECPVLYMFELFPLVRTN